MSKINRLPIELLALIFADVRQSERVGPRRSCFPFNVASTCPFWMEILKSNPANWQSIVIDIADDPTPFLDTFSKFKGGPIEAMIFSSIKAETAAFLSTESQYTQTSCENTRVQVIFLVLEPFITRCDYITFDLLYQSSLPSAAHILGRHLPHLCGLQLECAIYDLDDSPDSAIDLKVKIPPPGPAIQIPSLEEISLTGHYFMELQKLPRNWLRKIGGEQRLALSINQFLLQKEDIGIHFGSRSFHRFLAAIEVLNCGELTLSNLAFNYHPRLGRKKYTFGGEILKFDNVSPDFLAAFFSSVNLDPDADMRRIEIVRCSIPFIAQRIELDPVYSDLILVDIPFYKASSRPSSRNSYHISENSLYNAIELFSFTHLSIIGCEGVEDDFFEWLCGEDDHLPARDLKDLSIENCPRFTSGALRNFLDARETMGKPLAFVEVRGNSPMMSKDDAAWFLDLDETTTRVIWNVERDPNMMQDFVSDLRPPAHDIV